MKYSVQLYNYLFEPLTVGYVEADSIEHACKKLNVDPMIAEDTGRPYYLLSEKIAPKAIVVIFGELSQEIDNPEQLADLYKKAEEQWGEMDQEI